MTTSETADQRIMATRFFEANPSAKDEVIKAYFAYHTQHIRDHPEAHNFSGPYRDCACQWCGRSREMVRWDDLPYACASRPELPDIATVLLCEEKKAHALFEKAAIKVPEIVGRMGMSGETLAVLYHTHGYDPETVAAVTDVPPDIMAAFHEAMEKERALSRSAVVKQVVSARL